MINGTDIIRFAFTGELSEEYFISFDGNTTKIFGPPRRSHVGLCTWLRSITHIGY